MLAKMSSAEKVYGVGWPRYVMKSEEKGVEFIEEKSSKSLLLDGLDF